MNQSTTRRLAAAMCALLTIFALLAISGCDQRLEGVRGSGTFEATEITVSARTQGEIISVDADEGMRVGANSILAEIDARDLQLQLVQSEQRLESTRANLDLLLAGSRSEDVRQAEAQVAEASQAFQLAQSSYRRIDRLFSAGSATESDRDKAQTAFEQARARLSSAQAQLEKMRNIARPEEIRAARARVAETEAGVERLRLKIEDATVRAPIDGTVTVQARDAGEYVAPGSALFTIADLSTLYLTIYIPEPSLAYVSLGEDARIFVDGVPDRTFTGTITRIADEAEFTPKNVQTQDARAELVFAVEIQVENPEGVLKIGMPADALLADASDPAAGTDSDGASQ